MTAPHYQARHRAAVGPWHRHDSAVKSLVSVPTKLMADSAPTMARSRPGNKEREIVNRINRLLELEPGWDGAHAQPLTFSAVEATVEVLSDVMIEAIPVPDVSPSVDGGMLLEWHEGGFELEIWASANGAVTVTYDHDGNSWDGDWETCAEGARLVLSHLAGTTPHLVE